MFTTGRVAEPVQMYLDFSGTPGSLSQLMAGDLSFKGVQTGYASHNTHAFAAKFPPQLPAAFIRELTAEGEVVLDPMAGSGTTIVEAALAGRIGIGIDLDPLATKIALAKTSPIHPGHAAVAAEQITSHARLLLATRGEKLRDMALSQMSPDSRRFVEYWFQPHTIAELAALVSSIRTQCVEPRVRNFFEVLLSSAIVTKSGGVSMARDLAHSRPHRVASKRVKSALDLFALRAKKSLAMLDEMRRAPGSGYTLKGNARKLPLQDESVDLVVTSPPYANAIDYVRAHKFSLVWFGYDVATLREHRRKYIGAEIGWRCGKNLPGEIGPRTLHEVRQVDSRRAAVVERYFHEMLDALFEMYRVLKAGRAAVIVVGSSTIRGVVVPTALILAELAEKVGFRVAAVREREIDRDRRLMPISRDSDQTGIEARMHTEHVIGLLKVATRAKTV